MNTSLRPVAPRLSATERRAAQFAAVATKQADLKRECAERRVAREARNDPPAPPKPRRTRTAQRPAKAG